MNAQVRHAVFFESGRLGNQLLQYAVLRSRFPAAQLHFFGLDALRRAVACERTRFVPDGGRWHWPVRLLRRALGALATLRLIGVAHEVREGGDCRLELRPGLLRSLVLVRPAWFQHAVFESSIDASLDLDAVVRNAARRYLDDELRARGGDLQPVFVHLRRGDYLSFPDPAAPAALGREWTLAALDELRAHLPHPLWVVCSDDLPYARALLAGQDAVFCDRGEIGDLAVMSMCQAGILSPSTFSWWAARLARMRLAALGRDGLFLAPRCWVGHRRGEWYPAGFEFPWIHYR